MPDGQREKSLRSSPSQRSTLTFVAAAMVSRVTRRFSRSRRSDGPNWSRSAMRVILGSNSRADNLRGQFPYSPTFAAARDFASVMHPRKPTSASGSYTDRVAAACLSFHAPYRCRHVGVCCETAWDIEVDAPIVAAVSLGRLTPVSVTPSPFTTATDESGRSFVAPARTGPGTCGFRHEHRCSLQIAGGERMLPTACRHFPRVYRLEPHRIRLTLSHYCPTAAALLLDPAPASIVTAQEPLALASGAEGLDVREALPPLLRPGMLMDHDAYDAWEDLVVASFSTAASVDEGFAIVTAATERIRRWHPSDGPLDEAVQTGFAGPLVRLDCERLSQGFRVLTSVTGVHPLLAMPDDLPAAWRHLARTCPDLLDGPLRKYLAATAFANWMAY